MDLQSFPWQMWFVWLKTKYSHCYTHFCKKRSKWTFWCLEWSLGICHVSKIHANWMYYSLSVPNSMLPHPHLFKGFVTLSDPNPNPANAISSRTWKVTTFYSIIARGVNVTWNNIIIHHIIFPPQCFDVFIIKSFSSLRCFLFCTPELVVCHLYIFFILPKMRAWIILRIGVVRVWVFFLFFFQ